jgi:mannose-1-phosphate guanylyltransferase / mannose-6-phosphate isomerase
MQSAIKCPWGSFKVIRDKPNYKVRLISISVSGETVSQKHLYRNDYWKVLKGTALVTVNDVQATLCSGEDLFIPRMMRHRLANGGDIPLEVIEVQTGDRFNADNEDNEDSEYEEQQQSSSCILTT